jgi:hypothetical protein
MSKRVLGVLSLAVVLGACAESTRPAVAYTVPGWYLERPRTILLRGPEIFAGPFTYEQCESERLKFDPGTAERLLCMHEYTNPGTFGPWSPKGFDTTPH